MNALRALGASLALGSSVASQIWLIAGPAPLLEAAAALRAHRAAQGFEVISIAVPQQGDPADVAAELQRRIHARIGEAEQPGYVLLIGDSEGGGFPVPSLRRPGLRAFAASYDVGLERVWSDLGYVDRDDDGVPEWACGRLPVTTVDELHQIAAKIIAYESSAPGSLDEVLWRRACAIVANPGNFGALVDSVIENAVNRLFREELDARFQLKGALGIERSPFYQAPVGFRDAVVGLFDAGPVALIYAGHGSPIRFARVHGRPVFDVEDVPSLRGAERTLLIAWACHIGNFTTDCLGEVALRAEHGPCAVLAASEVSFPYGDVLLGLELMRCLGEHDAPRLGDIVRQAKRALLAEPQGDRFRKNAETLATTVGLASDLRASLRRYTADLYQLLGDPAMVLQIPAALAIERTEDTEHELRFRIRAAVAHPTTLRVELCIDRGATDDRTRDVLSARTLEWNSDQETLDCAFPRDLIRSGRVSLRAVGYGDGRAWAGGLRFRTPR